MNVVIEQFETLPCSRRFTINGVRAVLSDFGYMVDTAPEEAEGFECGCMEFTPKNFPEEGVCEKYGITKFQWHEICDILINRMYVGSCGWCV